jgi:hypothetical protein
MASPHVAGAAALVWSRPDVATNAQVVSILLNSANRQGVDTVRLDSWTANGGLNLHDAMHYGVTTNLPPTARAGADQTVIDTDGDGREPVTLDGSASTDPDGTIVSYEWREGSVIVGTTASISVSLSVGVHTLTLQVIDDDGSTSVDSVVVTVNAAPSLPTSVHVADLDGSAASSRNAWSALVTVMAHNTNHQPVAGAVVTGTWGGGTNGTGTCTTGTSGTCTVLSSSVPKKQGFVTFTVSSVAASGLVYQSTQNHDPEGDSNGTVVTIIKP